MKSFGAELAIFVFAVMCAFILRTYLKHLNKKLDASQNIPFELTKVSAERTADLEAKSQGIVVADANAFRYLY